MKRTKELFPATLALAVAACVASSSLLAAQYREGEVLVKRKAGLSEEKFAALLEQGNGKIKRKLQGTEVHVVEVPAGRELQIVNSLNKQKKKVAWAEPNILLTPDGTPNDPYYPKEWHLPKMQVASAWAYGTGNGILVAVCDTGIDAVHPDFAGKLVQGWNVAGNNSDTSDIYGHGTKVAGVVAAVTNNAAGVASVAPDAKILAMRITDRTDGSAYYSDMAECVSYAADKGARVANISYSGAQASSAVTSAATTMMNKTGGVVVVSAGNDSTDRGYGVNDYVLVAGATDGNDARTSWSNYGDYVDIAAPGSGIYTTTRGGGYGAVSGTSFSSPNTAATVALVMSANPALTATDVTSVITNTAVDLGTSGWDPYYGHGRVDALAATQLAANAQTSDDTAPRVAIADPVSGTTVNDVVVVEVQATDAFGVTSVDFLVDGAVVATEAQQDPSSPYTYGFAWDSTKASDGDHRLKARARDAAGNIGSATEITVKVANQADTVKPSVTLSNPKSGASFTVGSSVSLAASATDNVGVTNVSIYAGGALKCSGTDAASCSWNTSGLAAGTYVVNATAEDAARNQETTSASITLTVSTTTDTTPTTKKRPPGIDKKTAASENTTQ